MRSFAFYGKGGIGKTTISTNISVLFSQSGRRTLEIGCDPKHDAAQRHVSPLEVTTAADLLRLGVGPGDLFSQLLMRGRTGVDCIEAGGPEPGTGCAGRSITLLLELLDRIPGFRQNYEIVVYDVLGDVVCGGFAAPLRTGHAGELLVVTSGEIMSLYAANNILKGFLNLRARSTRVRGLVLNRRGLPREDELLSRFADELHVPIVGGLPQDRLHVQAEARGGTVCELFPASAAAASCRELFTAILDESAAPVTPTPLDRSAWRRFITDVAPLLVEEG